MMKKKKDKKKKTKKKKKKKKVYVVLQAFWITQTIGIIFVERFLYLSIIMINFQNISRI